MKTLSIYSVKKFYIKDERYLTYGGFGEYVKSMANQFDSVILCIHAKRTREKHLNGYYEVNLPNVQFKHLPWYRNELECLLKLPWMLLKSIWFARKADIINARVPDYSGICGAIAAKILNKPLFYNIIGDWEEESNQPSTKLRGILRRCLIIYLKVYVRIERIVVNKSVVFVQGVSSYARYIDNPKAYHVISSSIKESDICVNRIQSCKGGRIVILSVGRLQREKGHLYLLEAFGMIRNNYRDVILKIVGEGNLRNKLEKWVIKEELEKEVEFLGMITHGTAIFEIYQASDIFVLPSITEGTPKVLLEAMASGLPVIATNVGGVPSIIKHGENGYLVPRKSPKDIANAIKVIIEDVNMRKKFIRAGYETANKHTIERETEKIIDVLKNEYPRLF